MAQIALFGGSFDPIHEGHIAIASAAVEACELDTVTFVPAFQSPFKQDREPTPSRHRLAMCERAISDLPWAELSDWEIAQEDVSYSWQTAVHFTGKMEPGDELFWILGADQWTQIHKWSRASYLAALVTFIAFPRGNAVPEERKGFPMAPLEATNPASSTKIREALAAGEEPQWLNPDVATYIAEKGLYATT